MRSSKKRVRTYRRFYRRYGTKIRNAILYFFFFIIGWALSIGPAKVFAQDDPLGEIDPPPLNMELANNLPPLNSCLGMSIASGMSGLGQGLLGDGIGGDILSQVGDAVGSGLNLNQPCPEEEIPDVNESLSCSDFEVGDKVVASKVRTRKQEIEDDLAAVLGAKKEAACKLARYNRIEAEVQCISNLGKALTQQANAIKDNMVQANQQAQGIIKQANDVEADRSAQLEYANELLNGGGNGRKGLRAIQQELSGIAAASNTEVQGMKENVEGLNNQVLAYREAEQLVTIAEANKKCQEAYPNFLLSSRGEPTTMLNYVQGRVEQIYNNANNAPGKADTGTQTKGKQLSGKYVAIINSILGDMANNPDIPTNAGDQAAFAQFSNQPTSVLSVADIESRYGQALSYLDDELEAESGQRIHDFILGMFKFCMEDAQRNVQRAKRRRSSRLGRIAYEIEVMRRNVNKQANDLFTKYTKTFSEASRVLTGNHIPLDMAACRGATPEGQSNCVQNAKEIFDGLLLGTDTRFQVNMVVRGNNPQTAFVVPCTGIDGCITELEQKVVPGLQTGIRDIRQKKSQFVFNANQQMDNFINTAANNLSAQSQQLNNMMEQLHKAMTNLGIAGGINLGGPMTGDGYPQPDQFGLYGVPNDILSVIGSRTTPPLLDSLSNGRLFANVSGPIASGKQEAKRKNTEADRELKKVNRLKTEIDSFAKACADEKIEELVEKGLESIDEFSEAMCNFADNICGGGSDAIDTLFGVASDIDDDLDFEDVEDALDPLDSGIRGLCSEDQVGEYQEYITTKAKLDALERTSKLNDGEISRYERQAERAEQRMNSLLARSKSTENPLKEPDETDELARLQGSEGTTGSVAFYKKKLEHAEGEKAGKDREFVKLSETVAALSGKLGLGTGESKSINKAKCNRIAANVKKARRAVTSAASELDDFEGEEGLSAE